MKSRFAPWLMFLALMAMLLVVAHVVASFVGRQYQTYILLGGMLLAWVVLHWYTKRQELLLRKDVADMNELERERFFEQAKRQGLLRVDDHET